MHFVFSVKNLTFDKNKHLHVFRSTACANFRFFIAFLKKWHAFRFLGERYLKTQGSYRWTLQLLVQVWRA